MEGKRSLYCPNCHGRTDGYYEVGGHPCVCNYLSDLLQSPQPPLPPWPADRPTVPYELTAWDRAFLRSNHIDPEEG